MKPIEAKVRLHTQELQKHAARAFIHQNVLYESGLSVGKICFIEAVNDPAKRIEAVAWNSLDKGVAKNVVLLSRTLQKAAGFELGEAIRIVTGGDVPDAGNVAVRDVTPDIPPLTPEERPFWEYFVKGQFQFGEYIFPGLQLNSVYLLGPKRSFVVESVNGTTGNVAKYSPLTQPDFLDANAAAVKTAPGKLEVQGIPGMVAQLRDLNLWLKSFGVDFRRHLAPSPSCAMVLQGSRGTGKSMILDRVASSRWGNVIRIEEDDKPSTIQEHFKSALSQRRPTVILIDDIVNLIGRDSSSKKGAIKALREGLGSLATETENKGRRPDVVVIATCRDYLEDIPESLQSEPYFDEYIALPIPDASSRKEIIRSLIGSIPSEQIEQYVTDLGDRTHAYTGRDLSKVLRRVGSAVAKRTDSWSDEVPWSWDDVKRALDEVRPTAMHDITLKPPTVRWSDIGGYQNVKNALQRVLNRPTGDQDFMSKPPKGVLLYGPPGCSKTMTAQAMATESGFNFFAVKGGELLNMYVGETERSIRNLFKRARDASPSIIFFDEIDSIAGMRSGSGGSTSGGGVQALTTLLTEMDGFEQMGNVFVLAATNKPDQLDPALLRPGRFDELIYVPLPDEAAREAIFSSKAAELRFRDVDVAELARLSGGYSGAEIANLCDKAFSAWVNRGHEVSDGMGIMKATIEKEPKRVTLEMLLHFEQWHRSLA